MYHSIWLLLIDTGAWFFLCCIFIIINLFHIIYLIQNWFFIYGLTYHTRLLKINDKYNIWKLRISFSIWYICHSIWLMLMDPVAWFFLYYIFIIINLIPYEILDSKLICYPLFLKYFQCTPHHYKAEYSSYILMCLSLNVIKMWLMHNIILFFLIFLFFSIFFCQCCLLIFMI